MTYILNDYSIDSQFTDIEVLSDSLFDNTIPLLLLMQKYNIKLSKSYEYLDLKILDNMTMLEMLSQRGMPEISKFKDLLYEMFLDNPYWENNNAQYDCRMEAFNQDTSLVSIEHEEYLDNKINFNNSERAYTVSNSYNESQLLDKLREEKVIDTGIYLENKFKIIQMFCRINNKDYFEEFIKDNDIKEDEVEKIIKEINDFIFKYENSQPLGRLSDNLEANLHEFRTTLSDAKECRILYCLNKSKIIFLNCFIKKQQKTPEIEKSKGRRLRKIALEELKSR